MARAKGFARPHREDAAGLVTSLAGLDSKPSKRSRACTTAEARPAHTERPKRHPDLEPTHPGALLREIVVPATGRSKTEIAKLLGVSRQTLYDVLAEKATVTPHLAVRLGKMFGDGPEPWLRMQAAHDVWTVSRELAAAIAAIPTLAAE